MVWSWLGSAKPGDAPQILQLRASADIFLERKAEAAKYPAQAALQRREGGAGGALPTKGGPQKPQD
jgi:hypothetical protein